MEEGVRMFEVILKNGKNAWVKGDDL